MCCSLGTTAQSNTKYFCSGKELSHTTNIARKLTTVNPDNVD